MSAGQHPRTFSAEEASAWRRIRRYAVPRWMIERATERRLAGDWRGACAAASVDAGFELAEVAERYGAETGARVEEDLQYFAPDLARWHLPRESGGRTTLRVNQVVILAGYGEREADGPYLCLVTPPMREGPQRLNLSFGSERTGHEGLGSRPIVMGGNVHPWNTLRPLWDVRRAGDLRDRWVPAETSSPGADALFAQGEVERACKIAGIAFDRDPRRERPWKTSLHPVPTLARHSLTLTRLEPEIRNLAKAGFGNQFQIRDSRFVSILLELRHRTRKRLRIQVVRASDVKDVPALPEACWRQLPDLDLVRLGHVTPGELHPLVSASLFPDRVARPSDGPPGPALPSAVRVRCRSEWHQVRSANGRLQIPHSDEEERREQAMRAFGGPVTGCFAARQAWSTGTGRLPGALRQQRQELFSRVQHGDTPGVIQLLDAGVDPRVRDGRQRTLLHLLHLVDHEVLLPRLLDAGLGLEARDHHRRTPLHVAVGEGPTSLVHALLNAGARIDVADSQDRTLASVVLLRNRPDLLFLAKRVLREYPDLEWQVSFPARHDFTDDELKELGIG